MVDGAAAPVGRSGHQSAQSPPVRPCNSLTGFIGTSPTGSDAGTGTGQSAAPMLSSTGATGTGSRFSSQGGTGNSTGSSTGNNRNNNSSAFDNSSAVGTNSNGTGTKSSSWRRDVDRSREYSGGANEQHNAAPTNPTRSAAPSNPTRSAAPSNPTRSAAPSNPTRKRARRWDNSAPSEQHTTGTTNNTDRQTAGTSTAGFRDNRTPSTNNESFTGIDAPGTQRNTHQSRSTGTRATAGNFSSSPAVHTGTGSRFNNKSREQSQSGVTGTGDDVGRRRNSARRDRSASPSSTSWAPRSSQRPAAHSRSPNAVRHSSRNDRRTSHGRTKKTSTSPARSSYTTHNRTANNNNNNDTTTTATTTGSGTAAAPDGSATTAASHRRSMERPVDRTGVDRRSRGPGRSRSARRPRSGSPPASVGTKSPRNGGRSPQHQRKDRNRSGERNSSRSPADKRGRSRSPRHGGGSDHRGGQDIASPPNGKHGGSPSAERPSSTRKRWWETEPPYVRNLARGRNRQRVDSQMGSPPTNSAAGLQGTPDYQQSATGMYHNATAGPMYQGGAVGSAAQQPLGGPYNPQQHMGGGMQFGGPTHRPADGMHPPQGNNMMDAVDKDGAPVVPIRGPSGEFLHRPVCYMGFPPPPPDALFPVPVPGSGPLSQRPFGMAGGPQRGPLTAGHFQGPQMVGAGNPPGMVPSGNAPVNPQSTTQGTTPVDDQQRMMSVPAGTHAPHGVPTRRGRPPPPPFGAAGHPGVYPQPTLQGTAAYFPQPTGSMGGPVSGAGSSGTGGSQYGGRRPSQGAQADAARHGGAPQQNVGGFYNAPPIASSTAAPTSHYPLTDPHQPPNATAQPPPAASGHSAGAAPTATPQPTANIVPPRGAAELRPTAAPLIVSNSTGGRTGSRFGQREPVTTSTGQQHFNQQRTTGMQHTGTDIPPVTRVNNDAGTGALGQPLQTQNSSPGVQQQSRQQQLVNCMLTMGGADSAVRQVGVYKFGHNASQGAALQAGPGAEESTLMAWLEEGAQLKLRQGALEDLIDDVSERYTGPLLMRCLAGRGWLSSSHIVGGGTSATQVQQTNVANELDRLQTQLLQQPQSALHNRTTAEDHYSTRPSGDGSAAPNSTAAADEWISKKVSDSKLAIAENLAVLQLAA